jgi:hypothetical protein
MIPLLQPLLRPLQVFLINKALKPRFQKVDSEVIEQALLPVPSDLNESELLEWFKKQHTLMKTLLVDLIKMNSSSTSLQDTNESQ